jgi:hypothetical protein
MTDCEAPTQPPSAVKDMFTKFVQEPELDTGCLATMDWVSEMGASGTTVHCSWQPWHLKFNEDVTSMFKATEAFLGGRQVRRQDHRDHQQGNCSRC